MKDINYYNTFIGVSEDCPVAMAQIPQDKKGNKTVPVLHYEILANHPYEYTQMDVLFEVHVKRNGIPEADLREERERFFSKGQPCLRTSSLGKRYGWGMHHNELGKVALYAVESDEYQRLINDHSLKQVKAMRSSRG